MTVLEVVDEVMVGSVPGRWVSVPAHLDPDCGCGEVEVLMVALPDRTLWLPAGMALEGRDVLLADCLNVGDEAYAGVSSRLAAAFGMPWEVLTVSMVRGQFVLVSFLEEGTKDMLSALEPEELFEMRHANPMPAEMVRALRFIREFGGSV